MKKSIFYVFLIALCVSLTACSKKQTSVDLRFRLEKGKTYKTIVNMEQEIEQTVMGMKQKMDQNMTMEYSYEVQDIDKEGYRKIKMTYDALRFEQKNPMMTLLYDSKTKEGEDSVFGNIFGSMVGKNIYITVNEKGKVSAVDGFDEIMKGMANSVPAQTEQQKQMVEKMVQEQEKAFGSKETFEKMFGMYADKVLNIGDTWETKMSMQGNFPMNTINKFTLKDIVKGNAVIAVQVEIGSLDGKQSMPGMPDGSMKVSLKGTGTGEILVDIDTGWIVSSTMDQIIDGEIVILPTEEMPDGQKWPMHIVSKITQKESK
ncbi:MAG: hypothetical protein KAI43_12045 [Candidatus Aureabacteria bacterium]|nr:hypothetical protein [Candidatus Auribacterota bacterium]